VNKRSLRLKIFLCVEISSLFHLFFFILTGLMGERNTADGVLFVSVCVERYKSEHFN
jgi:hypothetical protein